MDKQLYILEQISCRFEKIEQKSKVSLSNVIKHLVDYISLDEDIQEDFLNNIDNDDEVYFLELITNTSFTSNDDERQGELKTRLALLTFGQGNIELEESQIGFGLTPKDAILECFQISEDWD